MQDVQKVELQPEQPMLVNSREQFDCWEHPTKRVIKIIAVRKVDLLFNIDVLALSTIIIRLIIN
jgi:hypothetical protein